MGRSDILEATRPSGKLSRILGGLLVVAGVLLLAFGWPQYFADPGLKYEQLAEIKVGDPGFPDLQGRYPAEALTRYRISDDNGASVVLHAVRYRNEQGASASAMVFPPRETPAERVAVKDEVQLRGEFWNGAADAIKTHSGEDGLFVTWWDNAQRIHFLTGRQGWAASPVAGAYPEPEQERFWQAVGGGFDAEEEYLRQLARWLTMDAEQALAEMSAAIPGDRPVYFLMCLDDLARLAEMETLSGVKLPFEVRIFAPTANVHTQIADVKRWAHEKGVGAYLVQQLPTGGVRAWRITTEEGAKTLLARLLPFTTSLAQPLKPASLVYQSGWGAYLSIYEWRR